MTEGCCGRCCEWRPIAEGPYCAECLEAVLMHTSRMKRDFDLSYQDIAALPDGPEKAIQWAVSGLLVDGAHHKQWCLERLLEALGVSLPETRVALEELGYEWEEGTAP